MALLRWIHKLFKFLWATFWVVVITVFLIGVTVFGILQLKSTKNYIATQIEDSFAQKYEGVLTIEEISGIVPLNITFKNVNIFPDSNRTETVLQVEELNAGFDLLALLKREFIINRLSLDKPELWLQKEGNNLASAFREKWNDEAELDTLAMQPELRENAPFEILAPRVKIRSGNVYMTDILDDDNNISINNNLSLLDLNLDMFFEYKTDQRFLDIDYLSVRVPEMEIDKVEIYGQIYNDHRFLELNSFNMNVDDAFLIANGYADGVNLFDGKALEQLLKAEFDLELEELAITPQRFKTAFPDAFELDKSIISSFKVTGTLQNLNLESLMLQYGNTFIKASGNINELLDTDKLNYDVLLEETVFDKEDLETLFVNGSDIQINTLASLIIDARLEGDLKEINGELTGNSTQGSLSFKGQVGLSDRHYLNASFTTDSIDLYSLLGDNSIKTLINSSGSIKIADYNNLSTLEAAQINVRKSSINDIKVDMLNMNVASRNGVLLTNFTLLSDSTSLNGNGTIDIGNDVKIFKIKGDGYDIHLNPLVKNEDLPEIQGRLKYEMDLSASNLDDIAGKISIELPATKIDDEVLEPHLFYADIANKPNGGKQFRLTSTVLDAEIDGVYYLSQIPELVAHWRNYFEGQIDEEIYFSPKKIYLNKTQGLAHQEFNLSAQIKDYELINKYLPNIALQNSGARLSSNISADGNRLLFNLDLFDKHLQFNTMVFDSVRTQITGNFRYNEKLKESANFKIKGNAKKFLTSSIEFENYDLDASFIKDSILIAQKVEKIGKDASHNLLAQIKLDEEQLELRVNDFYVGSEQYTWQNLRTPTIYYNNQQKWIIDDFIFQSEEQYLNISGVYSEDAADSLNFRIRSLDLGKISDLINGELTFDGQMNGSFSTRTLTTIPSIEGEILLDKFILGADIIGDLDLKSNFNHQLDRFDTQISIRTDKEKYQNYYDNERRSGQFIDIEGYIFTPTKENIARHDTLYNFDVDVKSADLWFVTLLAPEVFQKMEGSVNGIGKFWGNADYYDFTLMAEAGTEKPVLMQPAFMGTSYDITGPVEFSKTNGLVTNGLDLRDNSGGKGIVTGFYNFNNFSDNHSMDLLLRTDKLHLLNNEYNPELPFYGQVYGNGEIRMVGTSLKPVLETPKPLILLADTDLSLPIEEETDFETDDTFIRFVESFEDVSFKGRTDRLSENNEIDTSTMTFVELFTLDLQFEVDDEITVRLIFDPVTGEVIKGDGSGRIRIRLQDQDLSIFGRFDMNSGSYQFVSGDIFTRRFQLESGSNIVWDGDPLNARLNISAVFSARPDIQSLTSIQADRDPNMTQRVPIDLVLDINGTFDNIQNDFFFRLPNTFESLQATTLATQINALNQNEDEKLLQATSFLLLESFIPSNTSMGGAGMLTDNLSTTAGAAVFNPLLSSQVISPLLSNQINSLLRSDLSTLDVDFSLNAYNQIDLGVALRLYNDKIILRRDGQITGANSSIGDLGATYRINRVFSVSAFHRRDPTFSNVDNAQQTQQAQDINGVGIEAVYGFDTWKDFYRRITSPLKKLFGVKDEETNPASEESDEPIS